MKRFNLIAVCALFFLPAFCQNNDVVTNYINTYKDIAIREEIRTGVPAAITLAQGILETAAGQCDLVKQSNNHFGIKCKTGWNGAVVYHDDDAKGECFRSYNNAEESYQDHSDFLKNRPNYAFLFTLDPTDYEGWAKGLKKAGYATNPAYASILIKSIVNYHLQDYTLIALQGNGNSSNEALTAANTTTTTSSNNNISNEVESDNVETQKPAPITAKVAQTIITAPTVLYPSGVFSINGTKVVYAQQGTSLFALASKYNISYSRLLEYNEINGSAEDKNQLIFLAKKEKKGSKPYHIVTVDERKALLILRK
ncbi:MAG: glucosaminidase domain-containing protein [Bacteroidota bacterium]|nr:glucosaminidase domain-containing protein [Bacteroidota bacterium]